MPRLKILIIIVFVAINGFGQTYDIVGPGRSESFGSFLTLLPNGNYVVCDPGFDDGLLQNVGAVYLFNGKTNSIISSIKGSSSGDEVGDGGIKVLANGNYVISSEDWSNGANRSVGAVTWGDANLGVTGFINSSNSLVGSSIYDQIGSYGRIHILNNGNYVVCSPSWDNGTILNVGAVTWCNGKSGTSGIIDVKNSLIGNSKDDIVGCGGIIVLTNGNYVISSYNWNNGTAIKAGAVTWSNGNTGTSGIISNSNSLVGSSSYDQIGYKYVPGFEEVSYGVITALSNGNYVVCSPSWDKDSIINAGAVSWGDGNSGLTGVINSANSLIGNLDNDEVGSGGATALTNGNYVINSYHWNNGTIPKVGAITWSSGTKIISGNIDSSNSMIGNSANDSIGFGGVKALTNGNFVVSSYNWDNDSKINAGAATWGDGNKIIKGYINSANSLLGNSTNDLVSFGEISVLTNGNYVVNSPHWNNGIKTNAGAVTWGNGYKGISGSININNSLVGDSTNHLVGFGGITPLTNGNFVVWSRYWNNGNANNDGAATWGNGSLGITGIINSNNSLIGNSVGDIIALTNGNYVVRSSSWRNGSSTSVGAVTWGNGSTGTSGVINSNNSLVGTSSFDLVGLRGIVALSNGNYVVKSPFWDYGSIKDVGAVTFGNGMGGTTGYVDISNSLIGSTTNDKLGQSAITTLANGSYIVNSQTWDNGLSMDAGAVTLGNGVVGISGTINACNSVLNSGSYGESVYNDSSHLLIVGKPSHNRITLFKDEILKLANNLDFTSVNIFGTAPIQLVTNACEIIADLIPDGSLPVSGDLIAKVWVETIQPDSFVKRHYEINPVVNPQMATGKITFYFTQEEFDNFNAVNTIKLPTNSADFAGIANVRIEKHEGASKDSTGLPLTYNGNIHVLNPIDNQVSWNNYFKRWEIKVDVIGFGGFFVKSSKMNTGLTHQPSKSNNISLFPNPSEGKFNVKVDHPNEIQLSILTITGQLVQSQTISSRSEFEMDLGDIEPGIYVAKFSTGEVFKLFLKK